MKMHDYFLDPLRRVKQRWKHHRAEKKLLDGAEVLFCSFPKSGRTWVRCLLGKILQQCYRLPANINFLEVENLPGYNSDIPIILFLHDDEPFWKLPTELSPRRKLYRQKKVILLVRHPADVLISGFYEKTRRYSVHGSQTPSFEGTLTDYIYSQRGGIDTIIRYLNIWANLASEFPRFLLLRYEDLHYDTKKEVQRMVDFLGLSSLADNLVLQEAIQAASFRNMRSMESEGNLDTFRLRPADPADFDSYKTRKGVPFGYREVLGLAEAAFLKHKVNALLDKTYGYSM